MGAFAVRHRIVGSIWQQLELSGRMLSAECRILHRMLDVDGASDGDQCAEDLCALMELHLYLC